MASKTFEATLADIKQRIAHSLALHKEMPYAASCLIDIAKEEVIHSLEVAEAMTTIIESHNLEGRVEPLWRALKYKLTGDEAYILAHPWTKEVMDDVLKLLTFEEEH